jgi:glycosyltransferase involved in cell wall biosynthesis
VKIGIDVRPLSRLAAGISRAVKNSLQQLQEIDGENSYFLYSDREFDLPLRNGHWQKRISRTFRFLPGSAWLQIDARKMAVEDSIDVFWGTAHALPLGLPPSIRKVLTINDLVWPVYSETMSVYNAFVSNLLFKKSVRAANLILVPSQSTLRGLEDVLAVASSRIRLVPFGVEEHFQPRDHVAAARHIAQKYGASEDYLCAVGTVEPRKNLVKLVEAVGILRQRHRCQAQLLIAGAKGWKRSPLYSKLAQSGFTANDVKFLGYVSEEDLPCLYAGASVFVFPSLYEGFGFPLLEAMACGAPVVASNASSIPELVGEAGLLVDPRDANSLADAIFRVRSSPSVREQLIRNGVARAARFKWENTARAMLAALTNINDSQFCASIAGS